MLVVAPRREHWFYEHCIDAVDDHVNHNDFDSTTTSTTTTSTTTTTIGSPTGRPLLAGMPQLTDAKNVYSETGVDKMAVRATSCGGACVNLQTDHEHCGACQNVCGSASLASPAFRKGEAFCLPDR